MRDLIPVIVNSAARSGDSRAQIAALPGLFESAGLRIRLIDLCRDADSDAEIDAALADPATWKDGPRTRELTLARDDARRALEARYAAWEDAVKKLEEVPA